MELAGSGSDLEDSAGGVHKSGKSLLLPASYGKMDIFGWRNTL